MTLYQKLMHATNSVNGNITAFMMEDYDCDEVEVMTGKCDYCNEEAPVIELDRNANVCDCCARFWE